MSIHKALLVGPDYRCKGGIASVINNYLTFSSDYGIDYTFIPVRGEGGKHLKLFQSVIAFYKAIWRLMFGKIEIVHAHPSEYNGFWRYLPFYAISKLFGKHIIFHIHGGTFNEFYDKSNRVVKGIISYVLTGCDAVIVLSPFWEKYFNDLGIMNTRVIPNAVQVPAHNCYNNYAKGLTYLGFIEERKGVFDLLKAFALIPLTDNIELNICGTGDDERLVEAINHSGFKKNIFFHGWVEPKRRGEIFNNTVVFILPSYFEALPMSIIEAMAFGIPIVSTNVGSIPEVVTDGVNGLLVNAGDVGALAESIGKLFSDPQLRKQMSENNYSKVKEEYSIDISFVKLLNLYQSLPLSQNPE